MSIHNYALYGYSMYILAQVIRSVSIYSLYFCGLHYCCTCYLFNLSVVESILHGYAHMSINVQNCGIIDK